MSHKDALFGKGRRRYKRRKRAPPNSAASNDARRRVTRGPEGGTETNNAAAKEKIQYRTQHKPGLNEYSAQTESSAYRVYKGPRTHDSCAPFLSSVHKQPITNFAKQFPNLYSAAKEVDQRKRCVDPNARTGILSGEEEAQQEDCVTEEELQPILRMQEAVDKHTLSVAPADMFGYIINIEMLKHRRIVDMDLVITESVKLAHVDCPEKGRFAFIGEKKNGLHSKFKFRCFSCNKETSFTNVRTSPEALNTKLVEAAYSDGKGHYTAKGWLGAMNISGPCYGSWRKLEDHMGMTWMDLSIEAMMEAHEMERIIALSKKHIDAEGYVYIPVIVDGHWPNRSFGHSYSSKSGCAVIIGRETKRLLYLGVRNKYCSICAIGEKRGNIQAHPCYKNWDGSSSAMEADIIVEGFKKGEEIHQVRYKTVIGDGDSSVLTKIIENVSYGLSVEKVECLNHLTKNVSKKLFQVKADLQKIPLKTIKPELRERARREKKFLSVTRIQAVVKYTRTIVELEAKKETANVENMRKMVRNVHRHILKDHRLCKPEYCNKAGTREEVPGSVLGLPLRISSCFDKLATHVESIIQNQTSNLAEHFMHLVTKFTGGKQGFFGRRASFIWRTYGASLLYTYGHNWQNEVAKKIEGTSPSSLQKRLAEERTKKVQSTARRKLDMSAMEVEDPRDMSEVFEDEPTKKAPKLKTDAPDHRPSMDYGVKCHQPDKSEEQLASSCAAKLEELSVDRARRDQIEADTVGQRQSHLWREERAVRLTASNFHKVYRRQAPPGKLVAELLYSRELRGEAVQWGIDHEHAAMELFKMETSKAVRPCGLFVDLNRGFLAASPDGMIADENAIVEIKCPFTARFMTPAVAVERVKSICLTKKEGKLKLKPTHTYMYQVQGQMGITGARKCYFVVWTQGTDMENHPHGHINIDEIQFDEQMWNNMLPILERFYKEELLVEICDRRRTRQMPIRHSTAEFKRNVPKVNKNLPRESKPVAKKRKVESRNTTEAETYGDYALPLEPEIIPFKKKKKAVQLPKKTTRSRHEKYSSQDAVGTLLVESRDCYSPDFSVAMISEDYSSDAVDTPPHGNADWDSRDISAAMMNVPKKLTTLLNGNIMPPVNDVDSTVKIFNTCSFDSLTALLSHAIGNNNQYANHISNSSNNFIKFCTAIAKKQNNYDVYKHRLSLLYGGEGFKMTVEQTPSRKVVQLDVDFTVGPMLKFLLASEPSATLNITCSNTQCEPTKEPIVIVEPLRHFQRGIHNLQDILTTTINSLQAECPSCKNNDVLCVPEVNSHIFISLDPIFDGTLAFLTGRPAEKFYFNQIPITINLQGKRFKFAGFVAFKGNLNNPRSSGHFTGFVQRPDGVWEEDDDLIRWVREVDPTKLHQEIPQVLLYIQTCDVSSTYQSWFSFLN